MPSETLGVFRNPEGLGVSLPPLQVVLIRSAHGAHPRRLEAGGDHHLRVVEQPLGPLWPGYLLTLVRVAQELRKGALLPANCVIDPSRSVWNVDGDGDNLVFTVVVADYV